MPRDLRLAVQTYAWGKPGAESAAAQLAAAGATQLAVDPGTRYAELWMGTHPNGPSDVRVSDEPGAAWAPLREQVGDLPFLFKVLSISKALSIQAHPDLALARRLHAERPDIYKDANHKPELAIALTPFEALCGFRPEAEVLAAVEREPELRALVSTGDGDGTPEDVRGVFAALCGAAPEAQARAVAAFVARAAALPAQQRSAEQALALRLDAQFPGGDVGVLCPLLLNVVTLRPGEALFLAAGEPHAYLSGDCAECMACSDNVVRAGLTPKLKDVPTLVGMLTYRTGPAEVLAGEETAPGVRVYAPPVPEFAVDRLQGSCEAPPAPGPSIALVVEGAGTFGGVPVERGAALLLEPGEPCVAEGEGLVVLRAREGVV